jgi:hypothetical protein
MSEELLLQDLEIRRAYLCKNLESHTQIIDGSQDWDQPGNPSALAWSKADSASLIWPKAL